MYVFYWKINAFLRKTGKSSPYHYRIELILFGLKLSNKSVKSFGSTGFPIYFLIESFSCGSNGLLGT